MSSEIDTMKAIETVLSKLNDPKARTRVIKWAWDKYAQEGEKPLEETGRESHNPPKKKKIKKTKKKKSTVSPSRPTLAKDLNLRPKGKKDFNSFITEKQPKTDYEKCTIAAYYLSNELKIPVVSIDHIYTCYKIASWRLPSNFQNALALTAHRKGWLDTSNFRDIKLTPHGENLVEQDLPKQKKVKK